MKIKFIIGALIAFSLSAFAQNTVKDSGKVKMEEPVMDPSLDEEVVKSDKYPMDMHQTDTISTSDCCMLKKGKVSCTRNGMASSMDSTYTFKNGTRIMANGTIKTKEGKTKKLKEGECVDMDGNVITAGATPFRKEKNSMKK